MLIFCHSKILHKHCLQFLLAVKMAPRETENNAYAKFGVTNKERFVCYGIFWSGQESGRVQISVSFGRGKNFGLRNLADPPFECHFTEVIFPNNI